MGGTARFSVGFGTRRWSPGSGEMRSPPRQEVRPPLARQEMPPARQEMRPAPLREVRPPPPPPLPRGTQPAPQETPGPGEIPSWAGPSATWGLDKGWRSVASRHVVLGLDGPGVPWRTGYTTPTHQPATESSPFGSPIRVIGGHLAENTGAILKGGTAQHSRARETRNKDVASALVHERLEAHGDPRDRVCIVGFKLSAINACHG